MPRANGFSKNTKVAEVSLLAPPQTGEEATEMTSSSRRDIRFGADDAAMDFSVSAKRLKRSGEPSVGFRPVEGNRTKESVAADPFAEPLD